jgi:Dyp-type peroxidase family
MRERDSSAAMDGRTSQRSLLLVAPIRAGHDVLSSLETLLAAIEAPQDLEFDPVIPFRRLTSVHFLRILIQYPSEGPPGARDRTSPIAAKLLFATDFDGTVKDHLRELSEVASDGLDRLFHHCEGWPGLSGRDRSTRYIALAEFVGRHSVEANTFYSGTVNRSVGQIRREAELREAIEAYLDAHIEQPDFPKDALGIRERLRHWIFNDPGFEWMHARPGPFPGVVLPTAATDHVPRSLLIAGGGLAVIAIVALLPVLPFWSAVGVVFAGLAVLASLGYAAARYLSYLAARDPVIISPENPQLVKFEDRIVQNQLTAVNYVKQPRWFRLGVLRGVLALINLVARYQATQGTLSGIPSIHFARWVIVDEGRRLLFFSNFDGSWQSYLGDFVDKASEGLTAIWSNTVGFPRTVGLFEKGAADEQRFKAFARGSQIVTHVWYSAYPTLTVSNINDNTRLRLGLYPEMREEAAAAAWLRMAVPREVKARARQRTKRPAVDLADVQGLVARSYRDLREAAYLPITFASNDRHDARAWLTELIDRVTAASSSSKAVAGIGTALNVAFTHSGLEILGLDGHVTGFSREFVEGMAASDHRQRLLGDTAEAAPAHWQWGGPGTPIIHAMLFLFAVNAKQLDDLVQTEMKCAQRHGLAPRQPLETVWLPDNKEHFGFHDGIAQPGIAGFGGDGVAAPESAPEIPAGEVILGYPNAYGVIPLSPTVGENAASAAHLPPIVNDPPGPEPSRDFGRNGSYVVFRQLDQNVKAFWESVDRRAAGDPGRRRMLAAKMVGRWPNGAPLVKHPCAEPAAFDQKTANDFWYRDDLAGDHCPIGAHIRRTNPRDGLRPDTAESLKVADRHRLLRRGRAYGQPAARSFDPDEILRSEPGRGRGLHFICFNTDISRQFEFVQSTWMNGAKFDGLYGDPDPMIAPHGSSPNTFTVQASPVRRRYQDMERFVTTVGGAYLFMPGLNALRFLTAED